MEVSDVGSRGLLLGVFAELRKANISCLMSVRLSVLPLGATRLPLDGFL